MVRSTTPLLLSGDKEEEEFDLTATLDAVSEVALLPFSASFTLNPAVPVLSMFKELGMVWRREDMMFDLLRHPMKRSRNYVWLLVTICGPGACCINIPHCCRKLKCHKLMHPDSVPRAQLKTKHTRVPQYDPQEGDFATCTADCPVSPLSQRPDQRAQTQSGF